MRVPRWMKAGLRHADRWRVDNMLREQPELVREDAARDLVLWRRLFSPLDVVRAGDMMAEAASVLAAEYCWGCTWHADAAVPKSPVAYCCSAAEMLRGASCAEPMTHPEACEAVLGRMHRAGMPILLIVGDGDGGLNAWIDAASSGYSLPAFRGRCPGGKNSKTGQVHSVVWAYPGLWEEWRDEEWCLPDASLEPDWLDVHVDRVLDLERRSANG
jgi:hypothetical protein